MQFQARRRAVSYRGPPSALFGRHTRVRRQCCREHCGKPANSVTLGAAEKTRRPRAISCDATSRATVDVRSHCESRAYEHGNQSNPQFASVFPSDFFLPRNAVGISCREAACVREYIAICIGGFADTQRRCKIPQSSSREVHRGISRNGSSRVDRRVFRECSINSSFVVRSSVDRARSRRDRYRRVLGMCPDAGVYADSRVARCIRECFLSTS